MDRSNEYLAKGLAFLVHKMVHKKTFARNYGPAFLADKLRDSFMTTRGAGEVLLHKISFMLCLEIIYMIYLHAF